MVGPARPRFASRRAAPLDLPDGPVDEDMQEAMLQELLQRQVPPAVALLSHIIVQIHKS